MADPKYEIDDQGNLVKQDAATAGADEREPVTPGEARRFLWAIALSEVLSVAILILALSFALPDKPVLIAAITVAYALFSLGMFLYLRHDVYGRVKRPY